MLPGTTSDLYAEVCLHRCLIEQATCDLPLGSAVCLTLFVCLADCARVVGCNFLLSQFFCTKLGEKTFLGIDWRCQVCLPLPLCFWCLAEALGVRSACLLGVRF